MRSIQAGILAQASNTPSSLPRRTPSGVIGLRFAYTATALLGIRTRFPVSALRRAPPVYHRFTFMFPNLLYMRDKALSREFPILKES